MFFILDQSHSSQETPLSSVVHDYPYQTVIVNAHPTLGTTLSSLVDQEQDEKEEGKEATKKFSSAPQSHCSGKPPVKVTMLHLHCVLDGLLLKLWMHTQ